MRNIADSAGEDEAGGFLRENLIKMDDVGVPPFMDPPKTWVITGKHTKHEGIPDINSFLGYSMIAKRRIF